MSKIRSARALVALVAIILGLSVVGAAEMGSAATKATKAKKKTTVKKKRPTKKTIKPPVGSPAPGPVGGPTPTTISKLSQAKADALAAFDLFGKADLEGLKNPENGEAIFTPVATGDALQQRLKASRADVAMGRWWDVTYEVFDVRIVGASTETAVTIVGCIRISGPARSRADNSVLPPTPTNIDPYITEEQRIFVKSASDGKWRVSVRTYNESKPGRSSCADGK